MKLDLRDGRRNERMGNNDASLFFPALLQAIFGHVQNQGGISANAEHFHHFRGFHKIVNWHKHTYLTVEPEF